jgi:carboxypeptidase family protein
VVDSGSDVMPGVMVTIRNAATATTRAAVTGPDGAFLFPDLLAGTYDLKAELAGFKTYEQTGIVLSATEQVALKTITLAVGGIEETVMVTGESPLIQTTTGARSGVIARQQMDDIALKGRDFAGYLKLLPGVIDTGNREAPGWQNMLGSPSTAVRRSTSRTTASFMDRRRITNATRRSTATSFSGGSSAVQARRRSASPRRTPSTTAPGRWADQCSFPAPCSTAGATSCFFFSQDRLARTDAVTRRRSSDGLSYGAAYTYELVNKNLVAIDPFVPDNRARNYTSAGRRPRVLVLNYSYDLPNLSRRWNHLATKAIFGNWQVSGVTTFTTGTYGAINYSYSNAPTGALSGTGAINAPITPNGAPSASRVVFTCDPNLPRGERTFEHQFRTECVAPPSDPFRLGTALQDEYLGPGYVNWDISIFKNVPLGGARRLQFRGGAVQRVQLGSADNGEYDRELRLHDRRVDQSGGLRPADRLHVERAAHSARGAAELLMTRFARHV